MPEEDSVVIVQDKARRAYDELTKPVVVSNDSWDIPALNGFPGPYMKSINQSFKSEDLIRLLSGITNRSIILHQFLTFYDGTSMKVFKNDIPGNIIDKPRGENDLSPITTVTALDSDNGKTIAEVFEQGEMALTLRYLSRPDVWHEFAEWYSSGPKT